MRDELGEALVAVEDRAVGGERQRPFAHLLDHQAVRLIGAAQRVDLLALGRVHDQRFDVAVADRVDRVLGLPQPAAQPLDGSATAVRGRVRFAIGRPRPARGRMSSPTSTRCSSDMSPISRRSGAGSRLISVGAAMIWSPRASGRFL